MEPKELSPDVAAKILDADFQNVVKKVAAGKPLTVAERARIEARAAGSTETTTYAKTKVELADLLGVTRRTLTSWQKLKGAPVALSNGLWSVAEWREFVRLRGLKGANKAGVNEDALKARKLLAEVEERELRIAIKKGDYVPLMALLEGKKIVVTGVLTDASLAFGVAKIALEEGATIVLTGAGRALRGSRRRGTRHGRRAAAVGPARARSAARCRRRKNR